MEKLFKYGTIDDKYSIQPQESNQLFFLPSARRNVGAAQKLSKLSLIKQKKGKRTTSHRYNLLPLLRSGPGGVQRELVV